MLTRIILILAIIILSYLLYPINYKRFENFETNQSYYPFPQGAIGAYYQQHSRYPVNAWWIPYSQPDQKCHLKAKLECHNQFCYDNCYENSLANCPGGLTNLPPGLLPYRVKSLNPSECPRLPPYPQYVA